MKILVVGGFNDEDSKLKESTKKFVKVLGNQIIKQGHSLLNACMTEFDAVITKSALKELKKDSDIGIERIVGYVVDGKDPRGIVQTRECERYCLRRQPVLGALRERRNAEFAHLSRYEVYDVNASAVRGYGSERHQIATVDLILTKVIGNTGPTSGKCCCAVTRLDVDDDLAVGVALRARPVVE